MNTRTIHLALVPGLADWEPAHLMARVNDPSWQAEPGRFATATVAPTREPVTTMGGLRITPDLTLDELDPADSALLVVPGASSWDTDPGANGEVVAAARAFLDHGVPVAAICGATAGLARAGLLDGRDHTSSAAGYLAHQPGYGGADRYRDEPVVVDGGLITAGPVHGLDFARAALEALGVFEPAVLDAWYRLFANDDPSAFGVLAAAG